jgi:DNA-binding GntR family transcriptional regulator
MAAFENMEALESRTRRGDVVNAIRRSILRGDLESGARLPELQLAKQLGVSRPTLREALRLLVRDGWLTEESYKGVRVVEPDRAHVLHVAAVRMSVETLAVKLCAARPRDELMRELEPARQNLVAAVRSEDPLLIHDAHALIHQKIYDSSGNPILPKIWGILDAPVGQVLALDQVVRPDLNRMLRSHDQLIRALYAGDASRAVKCVEEHVRANADALWEALARRATPLDEG